MLIPDLVEPILTDEQTLSVSAKARGIELIKISSPFWYPFCTKAEKPPIKSTPISLAALSKAFAKGR